MKLFAKRTAEEKRKDHQRLLRSMEEVARYMVFVQGR